MSNNPNELVNNWEPETRSLIERLIRAGFVVVSGDNGEDRFGFTEIGTLPKFIEQLIACDEFRITIRKAGVPFTLFCVLGNSPGELVCDYSYSPKHPELSELLDQVTGEHNEQWSQEEQPKQTMAQAYPELFKQA